MYVVTYRIIFPPPDKIQLPPPPSQVLFPLFPITPTSLLTPDGSGIEIYFVENNLCVKTDVKKKISSEKFKYSFQPQRWYFVTISHEYHLIGRSELHLYVDNQKISVPMTYPKVPDGVTVNLLGCNNKISGVYTTGRAQPFLGNDIEVSLW